MQLVGQRDPRWAGKTIGQSKSLIKDYGCTISCVSMLSDWCGCFRSPGWLAKNLRFLNDKILWQSVNEKLCFVWLWRQYGYNEQKITESLNGKKSSVILEVYKKHWVVGIRKVGNYYYVADPWYPKRRLIHKSAVSGSSHFTA